MLQPTKVTASEKGRPTRRTNNTSPTNRFRPLVDGPQRQLISTTRETHTGCLPCRNSLSQENCSLLPLGLSLSSYRKHNSPPLRTLKKQQQLAWKWPARALRGPWGEHSPTKPLKYALEPTPPIPAFPHTLRATIIPIRDRSEVV
jgi:hypothetical protein